MQSSEILSRVNTNLALYYDPDIDPETKAEVRGAFVRALQSKPLWAIFRAFDTWERSMTRRPSPGDISILADRELQPFIRELSARQRADERAAEVTREIPSKERAAAIMQELGFTAKRMAAVQASPMARSLDDAAAAEAPRPHWSDTADQDSPEARTLRAAREGNALVQEARAAAARSSS